MFILTGDGGRGVVYTAREDSVYFWRIFTPDGNDVGEDGREGGRKGMMEEKEETCKGCKKKQGTSTKGGRTGRTPSLHFCWVAYVEGDG